MNSKKAKVIIFSLIIVGIVGIFCLTRTDKELDAEVNKIVEAIENKDMKTIEAIIFGTKDLVADEELAEFFITPESEGNGIIFKIIEQDSIKVKKVKAEQIVYEITAPELRSIFKDVMKEENLNAESFKEYIYDYIATADKTKIQVEVPYTYEDGIFSADYSSQEFMNGITGNLIIAYQELIQQMIQENSGEGVE